MRLDLKESRVAVSKFSSFPFSCFFFFLSVNLLLALQRRNGDKLHRVIAGLEVERKCSNADRQRLTMK